jgi:hypothetical protein
MMKSIVLALGCLTLLTAVTLPQEVVISGFPVGVGGSIDRDFFKPYYAELKALSDTLQKYPLVCAVITGGADGESYRQNNDAKNPGLALGRAHVLRALMIDEFKVDSTRLLIQSEDVAEKGDRFRYVSVRIAWEIADLESRLDAVEKRPPVEKHFTEVKEITGDIKENLGLQLGGGISSSPFGGIPVIVGAVTWKRVVYIEGIAGHTFWNNTFRINDTELDTKRRLIGGHMIVYPSHRLPIGIVGGWIRVEEISQEYYEYVRLSEGPVLGLRASAFDFLSLTAAYNPSKHRAVPEERSTSENGQFLVFLTAYAAIGGTR